MTDTIYEPRLANAAINVPVTDVIALLSQRMPITKQVALTVRCLEARRDYVESVLGVRDGRRVWLTLTDGREFDGVLHRDTCWVWRIETRCTTCGHRSDIDDPDVVTFSAWDVADVTSV